MTPNRAAIVLIVTLAAAAATGAAAGKVVLTKGSIALRGVIRDFSQTHVDFNLATGAVERTADVAPLLNDGHRPRLTGSGFRVLSGFRDAHGRPISLQAYLYGGGIVRVCAPPLISGAADSYNPWIGPWGGANAGPAPAFEAGALMPAFTAPAGLPPPPGPVAFWSGSVAFDSDMECSTLALHGDTVLRVDRPLTIVCQDSFIVDDQARVEVQPGASLSVWILGAEQGRFRVTGSASVNRDGDHRQVTLFNLGGEAFRMAGDGWLTGTVVTPGRPVHLQDRAHFAGALVGAGLEVDPGASFHSVTVPRGRAPAGDTPGALSPENEPGIQRLIDWYRDVPGTNMSAPCALTMVGNAYGGFTFRDTSFYPIDGALFGDQGAPHNYFFTFEAHARFVYRRHRNEFIALECSDDAWIAIDDRVVIDLGGPGLQSQRIELDRLGLEHGRSYTLQIFSSQRRAFRSVFELATSFSLTSEETMVVSQVVD